MSLSYDANPLDCKCGKGGCTHKINVRHPLPVKRPFSAVSRLFPGELQRSRPVPPASWLRIRVRRQKIETLRDVRSLCDGFQFLDSRLLPPGAVRRSPCGCAPRKPGRRARRKTVFRSFPPGEREPWPGRMHPPDWNCRNLEAHTFAAGSPDFPAQRLTRLPRTAPMHGVSMREYAVSPLRTGHPAAARTVLDPSTRARSNLYQKEKQASFAQATGLL